MNRRDLLKRLVALPLAAKMPVPALPEPEPLVAIAGVLRDISRNVTGTFYSGDAFIGYGEPFELSGVYDDNFRPSNGDALALDDDDYCGCGCCDDEE